MNLYILRHGEAHAKVFDQADSTRALTAQGRLDVTNVAQQFLAKKLPLEHCFASPYKRAQQTASLFVSEYSQHLPIDTCHELIPEVRAIELMKFIDGLDAKNILFVSHNPLLSECLALLIQGHTNQLRIVSTAELHAISFEEAGHGQAERLFSLRPENSA